MPVTIVTPADDPCAGYLGNPFQNQKVHRHAATLKTPIWNVDWKEKHWSSYD
jgi:hypothetical protein